MTTSKIRAITARYSALDDKELAKEFVEHDKKAIKLWNDIDNDTADEHQILSELIVERFVAHCRIGVRWNQTAQWWTRT